MKINQFPDCDYLLALANHAGAIMKSHFSHSSSFQWKPDDTPVTPGDLAINELVRTSLQRDFPHVTLIGEEGSYYVEGSQYRVIEDSIDGTIPYVVGLPIASFCIAVLKGHQPIAAVIYDPFQERMWAAAHGKGTLLNGQAVRGVSGATILQRSHVSLSWWQGSGGNIDQVCGRIQEAGAKWFNLCSAAICGGLIASGTLEASIIPSTIGWETAAMQLIVEEAGGKATDLFGNALEYGPQGEILGHIISNGHVHDQLVQIVAECQ